MFSQNRPKNSLVPMPQRQQRALAPNFNIEGTPIAKRNLISAPEPVHNIESMRSAQMRNEIMMMVISDWGFDVLWCDLLGEDVGIQV